MESVFRFRLRMIFLFCVLLSGCQYSCSDLSRDEFSFSCWNVQTFFDANNDGCEYSEFRKSKYWSKEAYIERLKRLCEVIRKMDSDVFVLEEIENEAVVMDIKNQLAGASWDVRKCWNYSCFAKNDGAAIGCAIFSRFPLEDLKIHNMDIRCEDSAQPDSRPLVQVKVKVGKRDVLVFANHWKSKTGSAEKTEIWRLWQEALLVERILEAEKEYGSDSVMIICGDFNKDLTEFHKNVGDLSDNTNVVLYGNQRNASECRNVAVYSPWISSDGSFATEIGSYYYKNEWERIDHIFLYGTASISDFEPFARTPWADEDGVPVPYKIYTGKGYSDHLPLRCNVKF